MGIYVTAAFADAHVFALSNVFVHIAGMFLRMQICDHQSAHARTVNIFVVCIHLPMKHLFLWSYVVSGFHL